MNTIARVAAVAGSLAAAAAVAAAIVLPVQHAPVGAAPSGLSATTAAKASDSPSTQPSSDVANWPTGSGSGSANGSSSLGSGSGSPSSSGNGSVSGNGSGTGHGSGSGTGHGSGSGSGSGTKGVTTVPSPTGTIGDPNVPCLIGYVWRQAYHGDYVCVTPATQAQAAADNAAANSRIQQGGGAYGRYTCIQGYVWRQVVPDDYTCVIPTVRSQAAYDNSQAGNRVAALHLWVSDWILGEFLHYIQINGDQFNFGSVLVEVRRSSDGAVMWEQLVASGPQSGLPGAALSVQTQAKDCAGTPNTTYGYYVIAEDVASGRWSTEIPIDSYC